MAKPPFTTNRRQLLLGTGAFALAKAALPGRALASVAGTQGVDPAYVRCLRAAQAEADVNAFRGDTEGRKYAALYKAYVAAERELAATPAISLIGVRSKLERIAADRFWAPEDPSIESFLGLSVLADLDRMIAEDAVCAARYEETPKHTPKVREPDFPAYGCPSAISVQIH